MQCLYRIAAQTQDLQHKLRLCCEKNYFSLYLPLHSKNDRETKMDKSTLSSLSPPDGLLPSTFLLLFHFCQAFPDCYVAITSSKTNIHFPLAKSSTLYIIILNRAHHASGFTMRNPVGLFSYEMILCKIIQNKSFP